MKHSSPVLSTIRSGEEESIELEWSHLSPHISTQNSKDSSGGSDNARRVSTGSESYTKTSSPSPSNNSSNGDSTCIDHGCDCHPSSSPSTP